MSKATKILVGVSTVQELVTDEELTKAWGYANFGSTTPREVIRLGTLKCLVGWHQGHTSMTICTELGLISPAYKVTPKGKAYLWLACRKEGDV